MDRGLPLAELVGGTITSAYENQALALTVEKDGKTFKVYVEDYDSDLFVFEDAPVVAG